MCDDRYPSRTGNEEYIIPRQDPVVYNSEDGGRDGPLANHQIDFYRANGYLVLSEYLPELVAPLNKEIERLKQAMRGEEALVTEPDSGEIRTIFKPFEHSELIDDFFRDPRILSISRQLLGSDVYMMQARVNIKLGLQGRAFAWHSDFETWHVEDGMPNMRALTAWIMLTENHHFNGPLYVIPGSHHLYVSCAGRTGEDNYKTSLKQQRLGVPRSETMRRILADRPIKAITGKPGTVVFHECNLLHGSPDNLSADRRSVLMGVYNSVHNRTGQPYGGVKPRPDFLCNRETEPLMPLAA